MGSVFMPVDRCTKQNSCLQVRKRTELEDKSFFALVYLKENVELILFFQIDQGKTASAARNWTNSVVPQTDATTFALSSNSILLLWVYCTLYTTVSVHCTAVTNK